MAEVVDSDTIVDPRAMAIKLVGGIAILGDLLIVL